MIFIILTIAIFLSVVVSIIVRMSGMEKVFSILKPFTTILIIVLASHIYFNSSSDYSLMMLPALAFSLVGDIFLLKERRFLQGLISFLFAHLFFAIAFMRLNESEQNYILLLPLLLVGVLYFLYLRKDLTKYTIPVAIYMGVIIFMNWQAVSVYMNSWDDSLLAIAVGSLFFSFSDAVIVFDMFKKRFKLAELLILSTYWLAIYLFVISGELLL